MAHAEESGVPLGLLSAFTATFYVTLLMILRVDLSEPNVIGPADQPLQLQAFLARHRG